MCSIHHIYCIYKYIQEKYTYFSHNKDTHGDKLSYFFTNTITANYPGQPRVWWPYVQNRSNSTKLSNSKEANNKHCAHNGLLTDRSCHATLTNLIWYKKKQNKHLWLERFCTSSLTSANVNPASLTRTTTTKKPDRVLSNKVCK